MGQRPLAVLGLAEGVEHPAEPGGRGVDHRRLVVEIGTGRQAHPVELPSGMASARPSRKPTTSQEICLPDPPLRRTCPPRLIAPAAPVTSTRRPSILATRPNRRRVGNGVDLFEQSAHASSLWRAQTRPRIEHLAGKVLSRGKLNKSNQWDGRHEGGVC